MFKQFSYENGDVNLRVYPNDNNTGWIFQLHDGVGTYTLCMVSLDDADELVKEFGRGSVDGVSVVSRGITHKMTFTAVDGQWEFDAWSFGSASKALISEHTARELADLLAETPGDIIYVCDKHKTISGVCVKCLL